MAVVKEMLEKEGPSVVFEKARDVAKNYVYQLRENGKISFSNPKPGNVPSIHIVRKTVPEVWEDVTMALMGLGASVHTGYDPKKDGEYTSFPSVEATVMMHIEEPLGEPRFHKHFLGGWKGFGDYKAEIEGVKDQWMIDPKLVAEMIKKGKFDEIKDDERWKYTYSQRFRSFPFIDIEGNPNTVNQLEGLVNKLVREPLSKSAQCITWNPVTDHNDGAGLGVQWRDYDSPCLQRFWFRLIPNEDASEYTLNVNGDWRSRDHLKAVPHNIYGVTEGIHEQVRLQLQEALEKPIIRGRYIDKSDSLHLYGHYLDPRKQGLDAEAYLEDVFRVASGEPISERLILPGTDMHDMMMEDLESEYKFRKENPDAGRPEIKK